MSYPVVPAPLWQELFNLGGKKASANINNEKPMNAVRTTLLCIILSLGCLFAQQTEQYNKALETSWDAQWISHPETEGDEFGVYLFKREFNLESKPGQFVVHVSADNRYKLYVNGNYITGGPARGDARHWRFESLDLAPYLNTGTNVVSAVVWNFAEFRPVAQHTVRTGFVLQGDGPTEQQINSGEAWDVFQETAYSPIPVTLRTYYVVGPGEEFNAVNHPWGWMAAGKTIKGFVKAKTLGPARPLMSLGRFGNPPAHLLVPRNIPLMEEVPQRFAAIRRSSPEAETNGFINGNGSLTIPANSTYSFLIDQGHLTNAYPILQFSGGKGSHIKITYAEALYDGEGQKGNRDVVEGKSIKGNTDVVLPDGGEERIYETLWWRTFRYVQLDISTADAPLVLQDFSSRFTGYPFGENAEFKSQVPLLDQIWDVSWRTQRLCSGENYFDCPYYEQLQYTGDTRIQTLISTYVSGDTRLFRNALEAYRDSYESFGLTQSRYPSYDPQFIPTFSLVWITMLHDYWMYTDDSELVKTSLPTVLNILNWYEQRMANSGLLGPMEYWLFVDWVDTEGWEAGVPPGEATGNSTLISLQYVYTLQKAAELMKVYDYKEQAGHYISLAQKIQQAAKESSWDNGRAMFADTPEKENFSQHTNIFAILSGSVPDGDNKGLLQRIIGNDELAPASYYFSFYLMEALREADMEERYLDMLDPWNGMLDKGLSTFAERPDPTRSDCHAWSASPMYFFLSMVCGIQPASPGFKTVKIAPHLGTLGGVSASVPHPMGDIKVNFKVIKSKTLTGNVILPDGLSGTFEWGGKMIALAQGENTISITN